MKLLAVITSDSLMRFVGPILSKLAQTAEIVVIGPDISSFSEVPYSVLEPMQRVDKTTRCLRRVRNTLTYVYWALLGEQSEYMLATMYDKAIRVLALPKRFKFAASAIRLAEPSAKLIRRARLNRCFARTWLTWFRLLERVTGADEHITLQIKAIKPDLVLNCPGLYPNHFDIDYAKAGNKLGIPTVTVIQSWDNLTKGLFSVVPDKILVWNEVQKQELSRYHALSPRLGIAMGSPCFDRMFEERFLQPRGKFCPQAQLDPERPFVLWAATSITAAQNDPEVLSRVILEMRRNSGIQHYQVLVRPHPNAIGLWQGWNVTDAPVWSSPCLPISDEEIYGIYNSIAHSVAVIGLSTSLFMEAAILDRPCAMIKTPASNEKAFHDRYIFYQYLIDQGFPEATENEEDCIRWLERITKGEDAGKEPRRRCVSSFLRPNGIDLPSADAAAAAIMEITCQRRNP